MYNDPNAPQPPYGQSPYEQQYGQQPPAYPPTEQAGYPPTQYAPPPQQPTYPPYGAPQQQPTYPPPQQYGAPPVMPVYVPPPQKSSSKTVWIVLGIVGAVLLLIGGGCVAVLAWGAHTVGQTAQNFTTQLNATSTADQQTAIADETPPDQQAQDYYLAISVQDYANAYSMLAPNMTTTDGKALTQTLYTQQAQAVDQSEGTVSTYTATADSNDSTKVTVQVTRSGGKSYTVHLTFVQGSYQWLISSFDTI